MWKKWMVALGLVVFAAACSDRKGTIVTPGGGDLQPQDMRAEAVWVHNDWTVDRLPDGAPAVDVSWFLPRDWQGESFAVYSRRSSSGNYQHIATVTSCGQSLEPSGAECVYRDRNVSPGESYEYIVATQSGNREIDSNSDLATVPAVVIPSTPAAPFAVGLDGAAYLTWEPTGAQAYVVLLESGDGGYFILGETDGTSFLDDRAQNGQYYDYRIAAIHQDGPRSAQSPIGTAVPRPDYSSEVIYAFSNVPAESGFMFTSSEDNAPIVEGGSAAAQWRFEMIGGVPHIVPLGTTRVTDAILSSALTCGPGADFDCVSVDTAPAGAQFQASPVVADPGFTYVFSVISGGQTHYGKIRVLGTTFNAAGETAMVFDWAFQLIPNETSLSVPVF